MEINTSKPGIARTVSERKAISDAKKASASPSSSSTIPSELKEGQRVKGQILDLRFNEVRIRLEPGGQTITAKLTGELPLSIGEEANFEVSENSSGQIVFKYIPESSSGTSMEQAALDAAVLKALTASGVSLTVRNKAITAQLLLHRMPVDKQTLQTLIKAALMHKEASPADLVLLYKNNIPLTAANIRLLQAYQNGSGQLLGDMKSLIQSIGKMLIPQREGLTYDAINPETASFDQSLALSDTAWALQRNEMLTQGLADIKAPSSVQQIIQLNTELLGIFEDKEANSNIATASGNNSVSGNTEDANLNDTAKVITPIPSDDLLEDRSKNILENAGFHRNPSEENVPASISTASDEIKKLLQMFQELPEGNRYEAEQLYQGVEEGKVSAKDILAFLQKQLPHLKEEDAAKLLLTPEYHKLLEQAFHDRWTLTPEKIAEKASVDKLYQSLQEDMDKLSRIVKSMTEQQASAQLQEPMKNLQENLQFMHHLNEIFPYIQLPIQLRDQEVHGELYVYSKRKLPKEKDKISLLLHLDMERLGSMNIHLQMDHNIINAAFYMEQPEAERLFRENMSLLAKALEKKGYSLHSLVSASYKRPDLLADFIEDNRSDSDSSRYTFDIRT